jgi:hypothetical protein
MEKELENFGKPSPSSSIYLPRRLKRQPTEPSNGGVRFCGGSARAKLRLAIRIKGKEAGSGCLIKGWGHLNLDRNPRKFGFDSVNLPLTLGTVTMEAKRNATDKRGPVVSVTREGENAAAAALGRPT